VDGTHESVVQALKSSQSTTGVFTHFPVAGSQESFVHRLPSSQFFGAEYLQEFRTASHVSVVHASWSSHRDVWKHCPPVQESVVQDSPSSQFFCGCRQAPVPAWHESTVQGLPSSQSFGVLEHFGFCGLPGSAPHASSVQGSWSSHE
jgi:hypothetical protein